MTRLLLPLLILAAPSARAECVEHADESVTCDRATSEAVKAHILDLRRDLAIARADVTATQRKLDAALAVVAAPVEPDVWKWAAGGVVAGVVLMAVVVGAVR